MRKQRDRPLMNRSLTDDDDDSRGRRKTDEFGKRASA
jgi:hypothetical protein